MNSAEIDFRKARRGQGTGVASLSYDLWLNTWLLGSSREGGKSLGDGRARLETF